VEESNARLVIEVEPGEPVRGWLAREGGPARRFDGLLSFFSLFERLRRDDPDRASGDRPEPPARDGQQ
jgi:hypothetical protein